MVKVAYTVGRFQPPTIGHKKLIDATIEAAEGGDAYVFVSSVTKDPVRNPLTVEDKLPLLRNMFKGQKVTFVNTAADCLPVKNCGGPGAAFGWLTTEKKIDPADITLVVGAERLKDPTSKEYFGPTAGLWGKEGEFPRPAAFKSVGHKLERDMSKPSNDEENMSGTKARGYVRDGKLPDFYTAIGVNYETADEVLKKAVDAVADKIRGKKGGADPQPVEEETISTLGPDGEPKAGGRRKTRRSVKRRKTRRLRRLTRSKALGRA
jgi:hypothetical protein